MIHEKLHSQTLALTLTLILMRVQLFADCLLLLVRFIIDSIVHRLCLCTILSMALSARAGKQASLIETCSVSHARHFHFWEPLLT